MDPPLLNILSLCSGAGQLDRGISAALARRGIRARHVAYAERQAEACAALKSRMEEQALEPAPIWGGNLQDLPAATRADQLRIAGNGVCWQQADWAYHQLLNRIVP